MSLGVDLVPSKTCSLNCIYCEAGKTTVYTSSRDEYVKYDEIIEELDDCLSTHPHIDFITFSGAGEPTLFSRLGELIRYIKTNYPEYKLCLITNSTMFSHPDVIHDILPLDLILPSLDAISEDVFLKINRPCKGLTAASIVEGLINLRKQYGHEIWLEIFIVPGTNDTDEEIRLFRNSILQIQPDQVQLNSLDRPGTEDWVHAENRLKLEDIALKLQPSPDELERMQYKTQVTIIANPRQNQNEEVQSGDLREKIITLITRRPSTIEDITGMLSSNEDEISLVLNELCETAILEKEELPRGIFYKLRKRVEQ